MAACLLCLTAGGGVPLFHRIKGDFKPLPFPVIGSLNGVHMFGETHDIQLCSTSTVDSKVVWKVYNKSLTLILLTRSGHSSVKQQTSLLDTVFQCMVLVYGQDELTNIKNIERFKREIKVCYQIVDRLLEQLDSPGLVNLTGAVDVMVGSDTQILQTYLDAFTDAVGSPYGCVLVKGRAAVATSQWWTLGDQELVLLSLLVQSLPACSSRDLAVFLPVTSPTVPHRLLTLRLVLGVEVCVLCGPEPSLAELAKEVDRFWRSSLDSLKSMVKSYPRCLPSTLHLDAGIVGLMILNTETHRCLSSVHLLDVNTLHSRGFEVTVEGRWQAIRAFYSRTFTCQCNKTGAETTPTADTSPDTGRCVCSCTDSHVKNSYVCMPRYKCYSTHRPPHQLIMLCLPSVPTYALRSLSEKTLQSLLKEKSVGLMMS